MLRCYYRTSGTDRSGMTVVSLEEGGREAAPELLAVLVMRIARVDMLHTMLCLQGHRCRKVMKSGTPEELPAVVLIMCRIDMLHIIYHVMSTGRIGHEELLAVYSTHHA